ncbi:lysylphosphatidylglycerol synthetase-like protein (DUF2156 family) [Kitasatospora sp. MAA4]|uniref:bifunctional lysylphosphatidylglycerol flippase/synthetase MprF n=1 Tax=Kitasatospora sp. MAA4 TaxID=3035093 RepID=UPI0024772740|nr:DUF2156 domain-containing protein [Kitasatospora sp. MAA4]MDH6135454.1 lysylphosphatidylglycerol synthetase-like protein (DUF2156 family) [Kitasatospora sp. MAA4]
MTGNAVSFDSVRHAIEEYSESDNPSSFLAVSLGNSYFTLPGRPGVVVYRSAGPYFVQFGGPFAPDESYRELLTAFLEFAKSEGRQVVSVQLQERDARIYTEHGFTVNQIGASYAVDLDTFSLQGTRFMQLRNKISRAFRNGLTVVEADYDEWQHAIEDIDRLWLPLKGEGAKELEFLVGQCGGPGQKYRRLFLGLVDGVPAGYILYSPVHGSRPGWMHDLSRRRPDLSPGVMEAINKTAIDTFREEGEHWLHFGFTPFTSLDEKVEMPGSSPAFRWFMHFLWEHGKDVYPAATQLAYKEKWNQSLVLTEYVAFQGPASVNAFVHIFRAAGAL